MSAAVKRELWAKSRHDGRRPWTLERHLRDTEEVAAALFAVGSRWGRNWSRFFRIPEGSHARLLLHLRVAALFHDLGKANEEFVAAVNGASAPQTLRHEHLSALVLSLPVVRNWLSANPDLDADIVTGAVLSHHMKASDSGHWKWCQPHGQPVLELRLQDDQVTRILDRVRNVGGLPSAPALPEAAWRADAPAWEDAFRCGECAARHFRRDIRQDAARRALLLATKAGLVAADAVASALVRTDRPIAEWIRRVPHGPRLDGDQIEAAIIAPRAAAVARRNGPFSFHAFQEQAASIGSRGLLLAACGAGKTLAAWKWAQQQARDREIGRVIFLYPTRGTATEGFRDYVSWAPEDEAALVHGTADYELEAMQTNPSEGGAGKDFSRSEEEARLFALGLWSRRYFSATVDQFLSFMEHSYSSTCLLPALADSAVILDEVHSFDQRMFDDLIAFLREFDVPVLCMTATLSLGLRTQLVGAGLRVYPSETEAAQLTDLEQKENHPRYALQRLPGDDEALQRAVEAFRAGRRVLWVVNVVARAQALADRLQTALGSRVVCYHSRYRLQDRQGIHRETVDAFNRRDIPVIAVTTQVCEMSLDLDADVLLSETAPIPSLVQRFGRANRHLARGADFRAALHVYPPVNGRPYDAEELAPVDRFLDDLGAGDLSQRRLREALERHAPQARVSDGSARFLDGGYFATPGDFRDADDFTLPCVLDGDLDAVRALVDAGHPYDGFVIGVPRRSAIERDPISQAWLPRHLHVAASAAYENDRGFRTEGDVQ